MKKSVFLLFFFCIGIFAFGQDISFREIKLKARKKYLNTTDTTIIYPVIVTKNKAVDKLVNDKIRTALFEQVTHKTTLRQDLNTEINAGLINLSYEVNYKKNGILSLTIYREGCGAYCDSDNNYLNFDMRTGNSLDIKAILETSEANRFQEQVLKDKRAFLEQYKKQEKENIPEIIDSVDYEMIIEDVDNNCMNSADLGNFKLTANYLVIMDPCKFPHVIRSQEPVYELKYHYKDLHRMIKPAFLTRLLK